MSAREPSPSAQSRQALSRAAILETAIRIADEGGVDGVAKMSMRSLARELGFEVMSLYNHIANKAELLAAGRDVGAPVDLSWSCYGPGPEPCARCESCLRRARAEAGGGA